MPCPASLASQFKSNQSPLLHFELVAQRKFLQSSTHIQWQPTCSFLRREGNECRGIAQFERPSNSRVSQLHLYQQARNLQERCRKDRERKRPRSGGAHRGITDQEPRLLPRPLSLLFRQYLQLLRTKHRQGLSSLLHQQLLLLRSRLKVPKVPLRLYLSLRLLRQ